MLNFRTHREQISKLMYYQLHRTGKIYALFAVTLIALPLITIMLKDISYFQRGYYNEFLLNPTCALTFPVLVLLWLLYSIFDLKRLHWKYNVQDRELILPVSRMDLIISNVLFTLLSLYALYVLQSIVYYAGYQLYEMKSPQHLLHNGFFLSMTRTQYYTGMFLPLSISGYLTQLLYSVLMSLFGVCIGRFGFRKNKTALFMIVLYVLFPFVIYFLGMNMSMSLGEEPTGLTLQILKFYDVFVYKGWYRLYLCILGAVMITGLYRKTRKCAW